MSKQCKQSKAGELEDQYAQRTLWAWARQAASNSGPALVPKGGGCRWTVDSPKAFGRGHYGCWTRCTCQSACTCSRSKTWTSKYAWNVISSFHSFFVSLFVFFCFVCRQADDLRLRIWIICTSRSLISPLRNLERLHLHHICTPSIGFTLNGTCTRSWDASTHVLGLHMTYNSAFPCGVLCKHSSK